MQSEKGKQGRVTQVTAPLEGVNKECYDKSGNVSNNQLMANKLFF